MVNGKGSALGGGAVRGSGGGGAVRRSGGGGAVRGSGGGGCCCDPTRIPGVWSTAADGSSTCDPDDGADDAEGDVTLRTSSTSAWVSPICLVRLWSSWET